VIRGITAYGVYEMKNFLVFVVGLGIVFYFGVQALQTGAVLGFVLRSLGLQ